VAAPDPGTAVAASRFAPALAASPAPDRLGRLLRDGELVGFIVVRTGAVGQAQPVFAERVGRSAEGGLDLAAERTASADAHSPPSAAFGLRQPVRVRLMPSGPGGPSTSPGGAAR